MNNLNFTECDVPYWLINILKKANDQVFPMLFIFFSLGIFVFSYSYKIGVGSLSNPGPGFFPFLLGILLFLLSLYKLKGEIRKKVKRETRLNPLFFKKIVALNSLLLFYALFLYALGYILTTFITLSLIFRIAGYKQWVKILIYGISVAFISYFIFTYLGVRFPEGILSRWF